MEREGQIQKATRRTLLHRAAGTAVGVAGLSMTAASLAACGAAGSSTPAESAGPVTLQLWSNGEQTITYAKEFSQSTPNVHFEATAVGDYTVLAQKALAAVAAGTPPDVSVLGQRQGIAQLAQGGALVELDGYLTKAERADFYPQFIDKFTYKGKLQVLPYQCSVPVLYWNKDMFRTAGLNPDKAPGTWDETVDFARRLNKLNASGEAAPWGLFLSSFAWYFYALVWQNGGEVFDKQGQPRFQEAPGVEAAQWWQDLVHKSRVTPSKRPNVTRDFGTGAAAMLQGSQNILAQLERDRGIVYGSAFLPKRKQYAVSIGGNAIGVFKPAAKGTAGNQKAAWQFVNWITGTEMGGRIVAETGYLPLRRSTVQTAQTKAFFASHPYADVPVQQMQHLQPAPVQLVDDVLWSELEKGLGTLETDPQANARAMLDAVAAQVRQLQAR